MMPYTVYVIPRALRELDDLPGHVRQRARRAISALATEPRPSESTALTLPGIASEVRRIRLDRWRIIYRVVDADQAVDVFAVRKGPPYDYGDIAQLLADYT
jgi:mRNA-degrading endonuclease RelE of RelBE toxin-antitoxin system